MTSSHKSAGSWSIETWLAIISLAFGSFALVSSEFLPAALLTPMAQELKISEGLAGQAVTVTALFAGLAAPLLALLIGRFDRKLASLGLCSLVIASNLVAAATSEFALLLTARAMLGIAIGGFFALAGAIAVQLVSLAGMGRGMSIVFVGISAATVAAPALGAIIGDTMGWRSAFIAAAACGVIAFILQALCLPSVPGMSATNLSSLLGLFRRTQVRAGLVIALLFFGGHIAGFTFLRPFLEASAQINPSELAGILLLFGLFSLIGSAVGGSMADRMLRRGFAFTSCILSGATLGLALLGSNFLLIYAFAGIWGLASGAAPVMIQTWMGRAAPDQLEAVGGLFLAVLQFGLVVGASLGGIAVDTYGVGAAFFVAAAFAIAASALILFSRAPGSVSASPLAG